MQRHFLERIKKKHGLLGFKQIKIENILDHLKI